MGVRLGLLALCCEPISEQYGLVTTSSSFSDEEWSRIVRAPFVAGVAIAPADPGGPIGTTKETTATLRIATDPGIEENP
jgi:hypothetical protein